MKKKNEAGKAIRIDIRKWREDAIAQCLTLVLLTAQITRMYSSYGDGKGRSKSTLDVFRAAEDASEQQPSLGSSTMSRYGRRRRTPAPPQVKRVRSYLSEDIRRQFELGFEKSTPATTAQLPQSPSSSSFVKRLVATLERKQREDGGGYARAAAADLYGASYRQSSKDFVEEVATIPGPKLDKKQIFLERFNSDLVLPRYLQPVPFSLLLSHLRAFINEALRFFNGLIERCAM
jgi:hypothetical protein